MLAVKMELEVTTADSSALPRLILKSDETPFGTDNAQVDHGCSSRRTSGEGSHTTRPRAVAS